MGADIKNLRTRMKSVNSTLHLTKAMGLVASSKIRRAIDSMTKGREYAEAVSETVKQLTASSECIKSPYMAKRDGGRVRIIVIAGDILISLVLGLKVKPHTATVFPAKFIP